MFDLEQLSQQLERLQRELKAKPSLRRIIDADLNHNLRALRLLGVLRGNSPSGREEKQPPPVSTSDSAATVRRNRHGGHRKGAGRKRLYHSDAEKKRAYRQRVSVSTKSSLQAANFVE